MSGKLDNGERLMFSLLMALAGAMVVMVFAFYLLAPEQAIVVTVLGMVAAGLIGWRKAQAVLDWMERTDV